MSSAIEPEPTGEPGLDALLGVLGAVNVILHDEAGTIAGWTRGAEQLLGWRRDDVIGRPMFELFLDAPAGPIDDIETALAETGAWEGELHYRRQGGDRVWVASRWTTTEVAGRRLVLQVNSDISRLKGDQADLAAREAHLRSILDTVPEAMIVIDEAGRIASFSTAAERLFGYARGDVFGRNVSLLMPSPDRDQHDDYIRRYLTTGKRRIIGYGRIVTGLKKDGTRFPMELAVGETNANGRRIFTGFIRDLTSRHKMEDELRQAQKMEAIGQLTGGIAHDFNNLLTVISGNLEMIERRLDSERLLSLLREAQGAADDGARLTGQLLAFGRRQPLNAQLADVGDLVSNFSDLLRRSLGERIELQTIITGSSNRALVDASQLQNALLNLALNARDAMPRGGRLTVEISHVEIFLDEAPSYPNIRPGDYVMIAVSDTGTGMTEEVKQRAFEPFFTTKGTGSGTGLGLSMVYGFVKQSGGHIQLDSEAGQGTTVRLLLPAGRSRAAGSIEAAGEGGAAPDIPGGSETILVVEDDPRVRRIAVARLADMGYTAIEAGNAAEALLFARTNAEIDVLFTDVVMPGGMAGDELAAEVRKLRPGIKVLFTSGYAEPSVAGREQAETGGWLKKPYAARELATRLRTLIDGAPPAARPPGKHTP